MPFTELRRSQQDGGATGVARNYKKRVCAACRRRHYKCDGVGPRCAQCKIAKLECIWSDKARAPSRSNDVAELRERLAILESTVEILVARSASPPGNSIATPSNGGTSQWTLNPAPSAFASLLEPGTDPLDHLLPAFPDNPSSTLTWCAPSTSDNFTTAYQPAGNARATPPNAWTPAQSVWPGDTPIRLSPSSAINPNDPGCLTVVTPHPREGALPEAVSSLHAEDDFANGAFGVNPDFLPETWWRGA